MSGQTAPGIPESPWLTVREAAEYARVSQSTIWYLWNSGRLSLGGMRTKRLVHRDHLEEQIRMGFPPLVVKDELAKPKTRRPAITRLT